MEIRTSKEGRVKYKILDTFGGLDVEVDDPPKDPKDDDLYLVAYRGPKAVEVIQFFGNKKDPETIEMIIFFRHGIRTMWPKEFSDIRVKPLPSITPRIHKDLDSSTVSFLRMQESSLIAENCKLTQK